MKLLVSFPLAALTLVLLAMVGFCIAEGSVGLLLVAGGITAMSWYITEGPRGWNLPKSIANLLILAASLNVFVDLWSHSDDVVGVLGRFAIWISLIKLYERKTHAEYAQLLWLSLILMIAGSLETRAFLFGLVLLLYAGLGLYVLVLYQLYAAHERTRKGRRRSAPRGSRAVISPRPVTGPSIGVQFRTTVAVVGVLGLVLSAAAFLFFPREVGMGMMRRLMRPPGQPPMSVLGDVQLLQGTRITDSKTRVLRLRIIDSDGESVRLPGPVKLRGRAFDTYLPTEFKWSASTVPDRDQFTATIGPEGLTDLTGGFGDEEFTWLQEITPLTLTGSSIFAMRMPMAISADVEREIVFNRVTHSLKSTSGGRVGKYRIRSAPRPSVRAMAALDGHGLPRPAGAAPYSDRDVKSLAGDLLRDASIVRPAQRDPLNPYGFERRAARIFETYLRENFIYTLDLRDVRVRPGFDPIVSFLTDYKRGHCEYFASAMTAMCQSLDIDARLVTGFVAVEYDTERGEYTVRESNAHAWVEVRTGPFHWETFDPTPPDILARIHEPTDNLADRMRSMYEVLEGSWLENIVDFDGARQDGLRNAFGLGSFEWINAAFEAIDNWLARFSGRFGFAGTFWMITVSAAIFVALLIVAQLIRRARRLRKTLHLEHLRGGEYRRLVRQLGFYLDMLDLLMRGGLPKPLWQPPRAFAGTLRGDRPDVAVTVTELTDIFYLARYGGRTLGEKDLGAADSLLKDLAEKLSPKR